MRIGVYGGTFNPPHLGHLRVAEAAVHTLELDELIFLPAYRNPLKLPTGLVNAMDRLEMVKLVVALDDRFAVSDMEITRKGQSYTIDSMLELTAVRHADYWFISGSDAILKIDQWKKPEALVKLCRLGVVMREKTAWDEFVTRFNPIFARAMDEIRMEAVEISSTQIRDTVKLQQSIRRWVTPEVEKYIIERGLYKGEPIVGRK